MTRYATIFLLLLTLVLPANAQVFPVQVNTQVMPPYTPYLSDYTAPGAQKLMVQLRGNDPLLTDYRVKLRITIEGVNITIRTRQSFIPRQPLIIEGGGVPQVFYGEDLAEYFHPNALDFSGLSRSQYEKGAKLPEGLYRFTIEVLDFNRNTLVSNRGMAMAWVILNDPPLLNLPRNDTKVRIMDPTNIPFTWTPRHTASPNSAFTTEYVFRLVEVWPANRNPYDAFLSQPPLYEVTTSSTQIIYSISEPALIPGRTYAWQVQAKDMDGRDLFKNQGRSEVQVFQFGDALGVPENVRLQSANPTSLTIRWDQPVAGSDAVSYRIRYRPEGSENGTWHEATTEDQWSVLSILHPNKKYQVQVRAEQGRQVTDYSAPQAFSTSPAGSNEFACNSDVQPPPLPSSAQPLFQLEADDTIHAGGYEVIVRSVSGSNGIYTGEGVAIVPWFASAKVRVTFDKIGVNDQRWLTSGVIKSIWNPQSKFLINVPTKTENAVTPDVGEQSVNIAETETLIHIENAAIVSVTKNEDGDVVIETSSGETQVIPKGQSASVYDDVGNGYVVDKEGNIAKTTAEAAQEAYNKGQREYNLQMIFAKGNGKYGFDEKQHDALASYYQQLASGQYIPWKALSTSQPDATYALLQQNIERDKIRFERDGAPFTPSAFADNTFTLSMSGKSAGTQEELVAYFQESDTAKPRQVIGKLNLASYDNISKQVKIVPVNMKLPDGLTAANIQNALDDIYRQAVAGWQVTVADKQIDVTLDGPFDDGKSDLLSNYTADMKKVINSYGPLDAGVYYLFLIGGTPESGSQALGYMPRSKQAGFIFTGNHKSAAAIVRTMAHELGHGVFSLRHPFKEFPSLTEGSTDNLMDYPAGDKLYKYQWDYVHDPVRVLGLFEDDEEGESVAATLSKKSSINGKGKYFAYLTPGGQRIILKKDQYPVFYHGIENDQYTDVIPGVLIGFRDAPMPGKGVFSGDLHVAEFSGGDFIGYTDFVYVKPVDLNDDDKSILLGLPTGGKNESNFAIYKFKASDKISEFDSFAQPILSVTSETFQSFGFFGSNKPDLTNTDYRKAENLLGENQTGITEFERNIIEGKFVNISAFIDPLKIKNAFTSPQHQESPEIFLIIKIAEYFNRYPVFFKEYSAWFDSWDLLAALKYPDNPITFVFTSNTYDRLFLAYQDNSRWDLENVNPNKINDNGSLYNKWLNNFSKHNDESYKFYKEFLVGLQTRTEAEAKANIDCLKKLINEESTENIYNCLIRASEDEIGRGDVISAEARIYVIKKLLNQIWVEGKSEELIVKLIKFAPSSFNADDFISKLEKECNVVLRQYPGTGYSPGVSATYEETVCLWEILFDKVNDSKFLFSGDNRKELILALTKLYYRSSRFRVGAIEYAESLTEFDIDNTERRRFEFNYNYQGIFRRMWSDIKLYYHIVDGQDYYTSLDVSVQNTNTNHEPSKLKVEQKVKRGYFYNVMQHGQILAPFDFVLFTNKSKQNLLADFASSEAVPVPAIVLYYASEVGNIETTSDLIQTGVDVGSLLIPGAQLAQLSKVGKVLYYADKISSVASMGGTAFKDSSPQVAGILNAISASTGIVSLGSLVKGTGVKNVQKAGDILTRSGDDIIKQSLAVADEVDNLKKANQLQELTREQALLTKEVLKRDKQVLSEMGHLDAAKVARYENSIKTLEGIIGGLRTPVLNKFDGYAKTKGWINGLHNVDDAYLLSKLDELDPTLYSKLEAEIGDLGTIFRGTPDLLDSWRVLKEANVENVIREVDLQLVRKYMNDFPGASVAGQIAEAGGYLKWIDNFANGDDVVRFAKTLGNGLENVKQWIGDIDDGRIYVAVHGDGSTFSVLHNGEKVNLDHRSLAKWIKSKNLGNSDIVLLTCADAQAAQNLANKLGGSNSVIAWEGITEVHSTGYIRGEGKCHVYAKSNSPDLNRVELTGDAVPHGKSIVPDELNRVRLGDGAAKGISKLEDWATLEGKLLLKLSSKIDQFHLAKMINKMKASGDEGLKLANKIQSGAFDGIDGFIDLIKKSSIDEHNIMAANQAIDKAEELLGRGTKGSSLRFEDDLRTGFHDVDLGIKDPSSPNGYLEAYQFKTLDGKLTSGKIQSAATQLLEVQSRKKILEFRCTPETTVDDINSLSIITEMKYQAGVKVPGKGAGIDEFHFVLGDGSKIIKTIADL